MDRQQIETRQQQLTAEFNNLRQTLDGKREEIINGEKELDKLAGRYAELEDMKQQLETKPEVLGDTPASHVIETKEQPNAKRK